MTLLAVARDKFAVGVAPPGTVHRPNGGSARPSTYDWRAQPNSDENLRGVEPSYRVTDLVAALRATHPTDAHFVTYILRDRGAPLRDQPRLTKDGLAWVREQGFEASCSVLVADVDLPGHASWPSPEAAHAEVSRVAELLGTAGAYATAHGYRLVQPLDHALPIELVEPTLRGWFHALEAVGLLPDWTCIDWTRHFRLPNVRRDRRPYISPAVLLDRMVPVAAPAPVGLPVPEAKPARARARKRPQVSAFTDRAPEVYDALVTALAPAVRAVESEWHTLFLALAGALCSRRVPPEHVPALCAAVSLAAGDSRTEDRMTSARTTVERWTSGLAVSGYRDLPPAVARALDEATDAAAARTRAQAAEATAPARPVAEVTAELVDAIRRAPEGLTVIQAQCGLGKTTAARVVARERAAKPHATPGPHERAPMNSKTAISVPTTALALQEVAKLRAEGAAVRRVFGPLSVVDDFGEPVCRFHAQARALANGGQSIPWEFCAGRGTNACEHRDTCRAADGAEGPDDARITVGPHGLLDALNGWAGATGLLVLDEPPAALETVTLSVGELEETERALRYFTSRYAAALAPALRAVRLWVDLGPVDEPGPLARAFDLGIADDLADYAFAATGETDATAAARAAFPVDHTGSTAPPIESRYVWVSRASVGVARQVGTASKVLRAIWRACNGEEGQVVARIEERDGRDGARVRALVVTWSHEPLRRALLREGSCVVTDANADVQLPVYAKIVGYDPPLHRFAAADGAPVTRTWLRTRGATRARWLDRGRLVVVAGLVQAVRSVVDWVLEQPDTRTVGIVAWKVLELGLRSALGDDVADEWAEAKQAPETLTEVRAALGPLLARLPQRPELGHYGALRGLDGWRDFDAVVVLGDPWPNLGDVQHEVDFLGLEDWEARAEALCRADLEQALGRLRTVHRARPGRLLAVCGIMPGGWGADVDVRRPVGGRPRTEASMGPDEVRAFVIEVGGRRQAAARLGVNPSTLTRYLSGERSVPPSIVDAMREAYYKVAPKPPIAEGAPSIADLHAPKPPIREREISNRGFRSHFVCCGTSPCTEAPSQAARGAR